MDIDTHVDGPEWWFTIYPYDGPSEGIILTEDEYWSIRNTSPACRCEAEVPGSYRGQQCPNYCEPGEYTCRDHPHIGVAP